MKFDFEGAFDREYPSLGRIYFAKEGIKKLLDDKCLRSVWFDSEGSI